MRASFEVPVSCRAYIALAVRENSDDSDDEGADFGDMGGEGAGAVLGDY